MSPIFQEALDNQDFIKQVFANIKAGKHNNILEGTGYQVTDPVIPAKEFLFSLLTVWNMNHQVYFGYSNLARTWAFSLSIKDALANLINLPKEHYSLLPDYVVNKIKKAKSTYVLDVKQLKFDEFAFTTFQAWLLSKKKLTSTESLAMFTQIRLNINQPEELAMKIKYIHLLWNYTPAKSVELCKYYKESFWHEDYVSQLPATMFSDYVDINKLTIANIKEVGFDINWFQRQITTYQIPVSQSIMTTQHSTVYQWITGVPKSTPLNYEGIAIAIDQIIVFTAMEQHEPTLAHLFIKAKQQLIDELLSSRYTGIKELLATRLANLVPIHNTLKDLHERF